MYAASPCGTKNDWWSYAMAVGFIASLVLYGALLVQAPQPAKQPL